MKISAMAYLAITTFLLITVTIAVAMDISFTWVFYLTCIGQVLVGVSVYKVLRDNYSTNKTFEDFYEDHPVTERENYR